MELPWEMMHVFKNQPVTRMPSLRVLALLYEVSYCRGPPRGKSNGLMSSIMHGLCIAAVTVFNHNKNLLRNSVISAPRKHGRQCFGARRGCKERLLFAGSRGKLAPDSGASQWCFGEHRLAGHHCTCPFTPRVLFSNHKQ